MRKMLIATSLSLFAALGPAHAADSRLTGKWRIEQIAGVATFDAAKTSFEGLPDGGMAATVGCNRMFGKPEIHGDKIAFGPLAGTRMACEPPLDLIEMKFAAAIEAAHSLRLDGATLIFADERGAVLVVFRRAD